jgi:hypothetical protein
MTTPWRRYLRALPVALAVGVIALLTLEPRGRQAPLSAATPWNCLVCGPFGTVDVLLNLALFVPLGFALGRVGLSPLRSALAGLALSWAVELLQATIVAGRDASLSDLITNTTGAALGALLARALPRLLGPEPELAARLAGGTAVVWLATLALTGWAVQPDLSATGLTLRKAPIVPMFDRFPGEIGSLIFNDIERDPGRLEPGEVQDGEPVMLAVEASLMNWPEVTAPIADVVDERWNTVAILGQLGQKITFTVRSRSQSLKLRAPSAKVYRALPPPRGQAFGAGGRLDDRSLSAFATVGGTRQTTETHLTPGLGWMLVLPLGFYPFDYRPDITSAVWTALPLLLLGYWTRLSRPRPPTALSAWGAVLATGLVMIPPLTGSASQGWETTAACAVALLLGWVAAGYASRLVTAAVPPSARSAASP